MDAPFAERRATMEAALRDVVPPLHLTPATTNRATAEDWFRRFEGAGFDGVIVKALKGTYQPDKRVMIKVKHERECDCVVAGFRWHKNGEGTKVGSLLLGLFDSAGALQSVGVCASFTDRKRAELVDFLAPWREGAMANHPWREWADPALWTNPDGQRRPGAGNRWNVGKDMSWEPLRPELVVQVAYDHMQGTRFRHTAQFRRWRPDKPPRDCTYAQLEVVPPEELQRIFATGR
jgi:ATP-dependent DNA ligase